MDTRINTGETFNVAESVEYAAQTVVSRTVLKKDTGNVTLFAFDKGEGLSEHTAPFDAMVHILDGQAEIRIGGTPHVLKAGEAIIMPANISHALRAIERFKMMLIMIKEK
ncbi:MAG TPA: cupin domain-containing protein [Bacteroidales bacterium]|nr:cupin domain-containing protein [Bacteroidales bacterium]